LTARRSPARRPAFDLDALAAELAGADPGVVGRAVDKLRLRLARLPETGRRRAVEMLCSLFYIDTADRPDLESVLDRAVDVLAGRGRQVVPLLLVQMQGSDLKSHLWLARALGRMEGESLPALRNLLATAEDPYARSFALYAIGKMKAPGVAAALPEVVGSLMHPDREVRDTAARTLGRIAAAVPARRLTPRRRREMFETLMRATGDSQPAVRAKAMRSLGKMAGARLLNRAQRVMLESAARAALGESEVYAWDNAFIVRREARETLDTLLSINS
jgi:hypothetical protein